MRVSQDLAQHAAALQPGSTGGSEEAWRRARALDADERPPPSSIVGRLDTEGAMRWTQASVFAEICFSEFFCTKNRKNWLKPSKTTRT